MSNPLKTFGNCSAVIGAQWGDEGKGKIVDILAEHYDVIARACGGANAGHTIIVDGTKHVFHLLPSGCLHEGKQIVLGSGLVIHLPTLLDEIETLKSHGIDIIDRLHISHEAHILFDYHKEIDAVLEDMRTKQKGEGIGTTKRGIGPAYMDKAARTGIRMEKLDDGLTQELTDRAGSIQEMFGVHVDVQAEADAIRNASGVLGTCVTNTMEFLHDSMSAKKTVLIEGAQATMLDIDHGTYPYVTSSSTTLAGALQGLGIPPRAVTSCIGVAKAYCTRVGAGAFSTEAEGETADRLRERGGEYGSTTGRPRRTGWMSIDDLILGAKLNGFTHWNITKLDVLDEEEVIPVEIGGTMEELAGWKASTAGMQNWNDLPKQAQEYIKRIEKETSVPVSHIGTGPDREETIVCP